MDFVVIPPPKAPSEDGVYALSYAGAPAIVAGDDVIEASAWTLPSGIAKVASDFDANESTTTITVSGGTDGQDYLLTNTVTTAAGLTLDGFVMLRVRQPGATPTPIASVYAQGADMIARFGAVRLVELTDSGEVRTGEINQATLQQALADADAEINGYLQSRYTLPLATVPQMLNLLACDIALYRLMKERPIQAVTERYDAARNWLRDVAKGLFGLGLDAGNQVVPEGDDGPTVQANRRVFDQRRLREFLHPPIGGMFE
jgi:phage gp36-like protein